jgi:hypothetical protein
MTNLTLHIIATCSSFAALLLLFYANYYAQYIERREIIHWKLYEYLIIIAMMVTIYNFSRIFFHYY